MTFCGESAPRVSKPAPATGPVAGPPGSTPGSGCVLVVQEWVGLPNFKGLDLANAHLEGVNLDEADLKGVDLSYSVLDGGSLIGADLSDSNLQGASLDGISMDGVTLKGTNLAGVDASNTDFGGAILPILAGCPDNLQEDVQCLENHLFTEKVNYAGHTFEPEAFILTDPGKKLVLTDANFTGANDGVFTFESSAGLAAFGLQASNSSNLAFVLLDAYGDPGGDKPKLVSSVRNADFSNSNGLTIRIAAAADAAIGLRAHFDTANFSGATEVKLECFVSGKWGEANFENTQNLTSSGSRTLPSTPMPTAPSR